MNRPMKGSKEQRTSFVTELRADSQGDEMALVGYAASYNTLSQDLGGFREMIAPGAFTRSITSGADCHCLLNHDPNQVLGRRKSGTLTISEDERGLKFRCQLNPKSSLHQDVYGAIKRGDLDQCSFAFMVPDGGDEWGEDTDEEGRKFVKRTLRNVNLQDCSVVTYPAYNSAGSTSVAARSMPHYGMAEYFIYARKRSKLIAGFIEHDEINARAWAAVDKLNRDEADKIAHAIANDFLAVERQENSDAELRRKMQLAAGRLVK
jgi:HK97 family phage prohead protease